MAEQVFFVSYMIASDPSYEERYEALIDAINECLSGQHWEETTSFVVFQSEMTADAIAAKLKAAINVRKDIVVVGSPFIRTMKVIGANPSDTIYDLVDFAKKA